MFNKRGGVAIEEFRGALTYIFVFAIVVLFFYGCNISNIKKNKETFEFSKDSLLAVKTLNSFIETPVGEEERVADTIVESYLNNDYSEFENAAKNYFSDIEIDWRLAVYSKKGYLLYDSYGYLAQTAYYTQLLAKSSIRIPVQEKEPELLNIILEIREKQNKNEK